MYNKSLWKFCQTPATRCQNAVYDVLKGWQRLPAQSVILLYSVRAYCELLKKKKSL